ncbi:MAG: transcription termination factor NusA [Gemmatimonadetes bacterium]|nr:transcription termination factor NusA [Gemmatimonadota bacterium]
MGDLAKKREKRTKRESSGSAAELLEAFRVLAAHKGMSPAEMRDLIREGIHAALVKRFGPNVQAEITINEDRGKIEIVALKEVVEEVTDPSREISLEEARWDDPEYQVGDLMEIPVDFDEFGRTAVMAAKQRVIQKVREGERGRIREEYQDKEGELLSGEVQAIERGKLVVMLNKIREAEAIIPWREQNPRERFRQGEPIRAVLKKLEETPKGPRLILSRADPLFVAVLFRLEVPEVARGIVEIVDIAREPGGRTKVAVRSHDDSIDPVGACVGLKGSRVQAVVSELGGERIDIVPWHPDPEIYAKRALAPARVAKVISDAERKVITAIVDEDQLSLAIGRNGQNVRLASDLIGWRIDLYSSREWMERGAQAALFGGAAGAEYELADFPLSELEGISPATLAALEAAGYTSFLGVIDLEKEDFLRVTGISAEEAERLVRLIEELTVEEEEASAGAVPSEGAAAEGDRPGAVETAERGPSDLAAEAPEGQEQGQESAQGA